MKCPNCGYEIGPFSNAAATQPLVHNCVLPTNAAAAMPTIGPLIGPTQWDAATACAPQFSGIIFDAKLR